MIKDMASSYSDGTLTIVGMIIFVLVFAGAIYFTYQKERRDLFDKIQTLPIEKES